MRKSIAILAIFAALLFSVATASAQTLALDPVNPGAGVTITGSGSDANSLVELFIDGVSYGGTVADAAGDFSFAGVNVGENVQLQVKQQYTWYFNQDGNAEGWISNAGVNTTVAGGVLSVEVTDAGFPQIGNTAADAISAGFPMGSMKVVEIRLRNPGTANGVNVGLNAGTGPAYTPIPIASGSAGFETVVVPLPGQNAEYNAAATNFWLLFAFNGGGSLATVGDFIDIDYIRIREDIDFHFDNDGDTMQWVPFANASPITVSNGAAEYSNIAGNVPHTISYQFRNIDPAFFNILETSVDRITTQSNQLEFLNWLDGPGFGDADAASWNFTDGEGFQTIETDLAGLDWGVPSGPVTLNHPGGSYQSHFAPAAGDVTKIDYLRLRGADYSGPSEAVLATSATLRLDTVYSGTGVDVTGTGSDANSFVELYINGVSAGGVQADASGNYTFAGVDVADGDKLYVEQQYTWHFNNDGDTEGWDSNAGVNTTVAGGVLSVEVTDAGFPQIGNTAAGAIPSGFPMGSLKVVEIRLRNAGTATGVNVGLNAGTGPAYTLASFASGQSDFETVVVPYAGFNAEFNPASSSFWLLLAFNGGSPATVGDIIEIDYIRIREDMNFHFDNDGDAMQWAPFANATPITVSNGSAKYSNVLASVPHTITYVFRDIDPTYFNVLETRVDRAAGQAGQLEYFNWLDGAGYSDADAASWNFTDGLGYQTLVTDLSGLDWGVPSGPITLNHPGGSYQSHFAPTAGEEVSIDYLRLRGADYSGPSPEVTAITAPEYTLTYVSGLNGSITGTLVQTVREGEDGTEVTAVPDPGYYFVSWEDGVLTASRTDTNVLADLLTTATFALSTGDYTLTYVAGDNGSITGDNPQTVAQGSDGTAVTAVPDSGFRFSYWSDGSVENPRTDLNIQDDITVEATFSAIATQGDLTLDDVLVGNDLAVTGSGAPSDGPVELFINGLSQGNVVADAGGLFTFTGIDIVEGDELWATVSQVFNFNTDGDFEGWTNIPGSSSSEVVGGVLSIVSSGGNTTLANGTGDAGTDANARIINPDLTRVMEMRYRITSTGTLDGGTVFNANVDSGDFVIDMLSAGQVWNPQANAGWVTVVVDVSTRGDDGQPSPYWVGEVVNQLVIGANGYVAGDVIEVDYIRYSEGVQWEFSNDGDTMDWSALVNVGSLEVSDGELTVAANADGPAIQQAFCWVDSDHFSVFSSRISVNAGGVQQVEDLSWIDSTSPGNQMQTLYTDDGNFAENEVDLTTHVAEITEVAATWGEDATSLGFTYSPFFNTGGTSTATIDYLRLFPANAYGVSNVISLPVPPPNSAIHWALFE